MTDLSGRVALVTGGAGDVGRVVVERLARRGAKVALNCFHSYHAGKEWAARLRDEGLDVEAIRGSVARPEQVTSMFEKVESRYGRLDILVNNAAAGAFASLSNVTEQDLDRALNTNLKGALWCTRAAHPLMVKAGGGAVVNVSSIGAPYVLDNYLAIGTSKAALEAATRYLAVELAPDRIRVNTASCSLIDTVSGRLFPGFDAMVANTIANTPLGRLATEEDLANVIVFLASPESGWVTGQTILADGGISLGNAAMSAPKSFAAISDDRGNDAQAQVHPHTLATEVDSEPAPGRTPAGAAAARMAPAVPPSGDAPVTSAAPTAPAAPAAPGAVVPDDSDPVAVVGMGLAVPGASSPEQLWTLLNQGAELFVEPPAERWTVDEYYDPDPQAPDKTYQRNSGYIYDFTPHPRLSAEMDVDDPAYDPTMVWLRHSLYQSLESVASRPGDRFSLSVGYTPDSSQNLDEALVVGAVRRALRGDLAEGVDPSDAARAEEALGRRFRRGAAGPQGFTPHRIVADAMRGILPDDSRTHVLDTACSSSLYAIDLGVRDIVSGKADIALCGGSHAVISATPVLFSKLKGLSTGGVVRSLDKGADGVLFADGAALIVLKRLSRALADGDTVYGTIAGIGLSADGKGKAIYAPSSAGQSLAVQRALAKAGARPEDVSCIIAHATGTPTGDVAEFAALRSCYAGSRPVPVTSNKSLFGHTGWTAGVVSVIHLLLAMRYEVIPAQYRFSSAPDAFELDTTNLVIPDRPVAWPADRAEAPRLGAVSGFGFGGTDAHVLLREYRPDVPSSGGYGRRRGDDIVIIGWSGRLPGMGDSEDLARWAAGGSEAPPRSFGDAYPAPPFQRFRVPPTTVRTLDRAQLMLVECMQDLAPEIHDACLRRGERAGVLVGHMGLTRHAHLYHMRAHMDAIEEVLTTSGGAGMAKFAYRLRSAVDDLLAAPTEDSFPGEMPNIIASRISNYFDLRGLNMTVDLGEASLIEAFEVAVGYLEFDDLDIALVGGVNGNSLPEWADPIGGMLSSEPEGRDVSEGAFLFVLTRRSVADRDGLPVLAVIERDKTQGGDGR
ncbi:SDR family oxidoreductase [Actinoallomurus spadix]|uniref:Ketosynthase family 3 (KS3) domain-containing protein n=1 Tax=Actinoallomurus spadix TaxID=79912 RepID=A0ABP3GQE7_9ACTN|nr:SDR family oxidoreductase [Actinoallomurus spadix]MCO5989589.1 SDR family oxidoreductase [Actinoallomurus spadix]